MTACAYQPATHWLGSAAIRACQSSDVGYSFRVAQSDPPRVSGPFSPMTAPDHRRQTREGYDVVAEDYATLVPGLSAEAAPNIAMIEDFAKRRLEAPWDPVADVGCGTGRLSNHRSARGLTSSALTCPPA